MVARWLLVLVARLACPTPTPASAETVLRAAMHSDLKIIDPSE